MSLLQVGPIIFGGTPRIIQYLKMHGLLASANGLFKVRKSSYISSHCVIVRMPLPLTRCRNVRMVERPRTDVSDGISWYCPYCYTRKSIREKSFFAKSCLPLQKWVLLIYMWVRQYPITDASEEAEVGEHTAIDVYQWLREVCSQTLLNDPPIVLGGPQIIVQIDESLFRNKPKVSVRVNCTIVMGF